jgi:uncharacterized protein (DUF433 family)
MDYLCLMNWQDHIVSDERVLLGKPTIKGTRIAVEFIIDRLAEGWSEEDILANYPRVTKSDLRAVFAFISEAIKDGLLINFPSKSA